MSGGTGNDHFITVPVLASLGTEQVTQSGDDIIFGFSRGNDMISTGAPLGLEVTTNGFALLDSNGDGVLNASDHGIHESDVTAGSFTKLSTVIDLNAVYEASTDPQIQAILPLLAGETSIITIFGVTGLTADDFTS